MNVEPRFAGKRGATGGSLFDRVGGAQTWQALSKAFHDRVAADDLLKGLFPKGMDRISERFAWFIAERTGGPGDYTANRGKTSLGCRHAHLAIGEAEADRWLSHMFASMDLVGIADPEKELLREYFTEIAHELQDKLINLYRLPLDVLQAMLNEKPSVACASDMGRTLLSEAAGRWDLARVRLLLDYGADTGATDKMGHDALYRATMARGPDTQEVGCAVVELLLAYGAAVDRRSGPVQSSALHNAARRGHAKIAELLISAGASLEIQDSKGETPLRRAVSCKQNEVVLLLLSRGANPLSQDRNGRTVLSAATNEVVRDALAGAASGRHR